MGRFNIRYSFTLSCADTQDFFFCFCEAAYRRASAARTELYLEKAAVLRVRCMPLLGFAHRSYRKALLCPERDKFRPCLRYQVACFDEGLGRRALADVCPGY